MFVSQLVTLNFYLEEMDLKHLINYYQRGKSLGFSDFSSPLIKKILFLLNLFANTIQYPYSCALISYNLNKIEMKNLNQAKIEMKNFEFMDNQIKSNQIKSNQIKSNQIKSNQIKSNQIKSNQIKSNQIKSNQIKSNQIKSNQIKSNQIKSNQIKSNQIKSNQIKSNQIKSNQIKSNQIKSNQIKSNQIKSKTFLLAALCVATGLWSCKKDDKVDPVDTQVVADFTFTKGSEGKVTFKNASKNATSYAWDFGDGNKATDENPTHTYTKDSTYTVKLTATNAGGSAEKTATVTVDDIITIAIGDLSQLAILENSPKGTLIGEIAATVANSEETPVYSIASQSLAGAIALEGNKMVIADASAFVYDTNKELTGEIQATVGGVTTTVKFTVLVDKLIEIPDDSFKAELLKTDSLDANGDGEISLLEAQAFTGEIGIDFETVQDPTGIEYLTNLSALGLRFAELTEIDVSNNTALTFLSLQENQLTAIDVSKNTALTYLDLKVNQLTAIDVSNNTALTYLDLKVNQLTAIDVSNNTALSILNVIENQLTAIDVSNNTALTELSLSENQLTAIDVSNNTALTELSLSENQLTAIDVSNNTALTQFNFRGNQLTVLDLSQNTALTQLDLENSTLLTKVNLANGNNDKLTDLNLRNALKLTCVQVDKLPIPDGWVFDTIKAGVFQADACN